MSENKTTSATCTNNEAGSGPATIKSNLSDDTLAIFDTVMKSKVRYCKKNNNKQLIDSLKKTFVAAKKNRYISLSNDELELMNKIIEINDTYVKIFITKKEIELAIINNELDDTSKFINKLPTFTNKCLWFIYSRDKQLLDDAKALADSLNNRVIETLKKKYNKQ